MTEEPERGSSDLLDERRAKLASLREQGIEPFPHEFPERTEMISWGVIDSFPEQKAQGRFRGVGAASPEKSSGRLARSEAMMTQRPATGSRRSSGNPASLRSAEIPNPQSQ